MQSTSSVVFFLFSIIFVLNIEAFIFSAPPVVEESEIQEPPSYIRLRRAGAEKLDSEFMPFTLVIPVEILGFHLGGNR